LDKKVIINNDNLRTKSSYWFVVDLLAKNLEKNRNLRYIIPIRAYAFVKTRKEFII